MRSFIAAAIDKVEVCSTMLTKLFLNSLRISIITVKNLASFFLQRARERRGKRGMNPPSALVKLDACVHCLPDYSRCIKIINNENNCYHAP